MAIVVVFGKRKEGFINWLWQQPFRWFLSGCTGPVNRAEVYCKNDIKYYGLVEANRRFGVRTGACSLYTTKCNRFK
jgi:hypothetical protein